MIPTRLPRGFRRDTPSQRGFSLVEMILALGLLGGVLISVAGMFVLGSQRVDSGKRHTLALSVAQEIQEEINGWSYRDVWGQFGFSGNSTSHLADTRTNARAGLWQPRLDAVLANSWGEILIETVDDSGTPPQISSALAVRITVTVYWDEGIRSRTIRLTTVRN